MGEALNSELEMKVMCGWWTEKEPACLGGAADSMGWFSPFAGACASGVRSICQHLYRNQNKMLEKNGNHANERNKDQWQEE